MVLNLFSSTRGAVSVGQDATTLNGVGNSTTRTKQKRTKRKTY